MCNDFLRTLNTTQNEWLRQQLSQNLKGHCIGLIGKN